MRESTAVGFVNEVSQHLLGNVKIGDHTILEWSNRRDGARRPSEHALGLDTDGVNLAHTLVDRHNGRL
jgi:hypothetical protein